MNRDTAPTDWKGAAMQKRIAGRYAAERRFKLTQTLLLAHDLMLGREHLLEDGIITHLDRLLLKVAHTRALREQNASLISIFLTGDDIEHGRFAGTVRADERQAVVFLKFEGDIVEQHAAAE